MGEDTQYCNNCQKDVANFTMHVAHCQRNIVVCAICQESVPKTQYQAHVQENHKELPCGKCGMMVPASDVFVHEKEQCPKRLVTCPYCELEVLASEAAAHDEACGARTDRCKGCTKFVMFKHKQFHYENDHKYLTPEEKEEAENASDEEGPECPICLGPIEHPLSLECGHVFCMVCVKGIANNNKNCAICRRDIPRDMLMDIRFCREEDIIKNYVNKPKENKKVSRSHSVPSRRNSDLTIPTARQRLTRTTEDYDRMVSSLISSRSNVPTTRYERPSNTHTPAAYTPYTGSTTTASSTSCADAFKDDDACCASTSSSSAQSSSTTSPETPTTSTPAYSNRSTTSSEPSCQPSSPTSSAPAVPPRSHHVSRFLSSGPNTTPSNTYTRSTSTPSRTSTSTSSSATAAAASRTTTMLGEPTTSSGTSSTSRYSTPSSTVDSDSPSPSYSRYSSRNSDDSYTSSTLYSSTSNTGTSMTPSSSSSIRSSTESSSTRPRRPTTLDLNAGQRETSEDVTRNPPENATQEEYDRWLAFQLAQSNDDVSIKEFNRKHERHERESRPSFRRSISMPDRPDDDSSSSDSDSDTNDHSNRRPPTSPRATTAASSNNASRSSSLSKSSSDSNASTSSQSSGTGTRPKSSNLKKRVSFKEDEPPVRRVAPVLLPCEFCDEMFPERDLMRHQTSCEHNETSLPRFSRFSSVRSSSIDALSSLPSTSGSRAGTPTSRSGTPTSRSATPTSRSGSDSSIPDTPNSVSPSRNVTSPTQSLSSRSITTPTQTSSRSSSSPTTARSITSPTPSTETRSITSPTPLSPTTESSKPPRPPAPPTKTEVKPPTPQVPPRNQVPTAVRKSPLPPPPSTPPVLPTTIVTVKDATPNSSRPSSTSPALNSSSSGSTISSLASGASSCTTPSTSSSTSPTPVDTPTEDEEESPFSKPRRGRLLSSAIFSWRNMSGPRSASEARNKYARSNTAPMEETAADQDKPGILTSHSATQLPVQTESPVPVDTLKSDIIDQENNDSLFIKNPNKYRAPAPPPIIDYSQSCPVTPLPHISPVLPRKDFNEFAEECPPSPANSLIGEYSPKAMRKSFNERVKQNFRRMDSKPMMKNERSKKKEEIHKKEEEDKSKEEEITCEFCKQIFSPENFRCHKALCEKIHEPEPQQTPTPTPENIDQPSRTEREKSKSPAPSRHSKGPAPQPPTEFERKTNEDNARRRFDRAKSLFNDKSVGSFSEGVTRGRNIERRSSIKEKRRSSLWDTSDTDRQWGSREVLNSNNFESPSSFASSSTKYGGSVQNLSSYQPSNYPSGHGWSTHVNMVRDDARHRSALNNSSNYYDNGGDDESTNINTYNNGEVDYESRDRCRSRSQSVNRFNSNNDRSGHSFFHEMRSALCKTSLGHLSNENNGNRYRERSCSRQRPNSMFAASSRFGSNPHLSMYDSLSSPSRSNFSITDAFSNASANYKSRYNR